MAITRPLTVAAGKELRSLGATISLPSRSLTVATFFPVMAIPTLPAPVLDIPTVSTQPPPLGPPALVVIFSTSTHVSSHTLLLSFNRRQLFSLSDILAHICDYIEGQDCVHLYIDVVHQATQIFDMGATFASELISAIKKDNSFEMESWIKHQVDQLVASIKCHIKAARVGKS